MRPRRCIWLYHLADIVRESCRGIVFDLSAKVATATSIADLEKSVQAAVGTSNLMEFARFDIGDVGERNEADKDAGLSASSSEIRSS
jgi:hypothetical protein